MSDLLNYIKMQKNKGLDDYTILQSTKSFSQRVANARVNKSNKNHKRAVMKGGAYTLSAEDKVSVLKSLETIDSNADGYAALLAAANSDDGTIEGYDSFEDITAKLSSMAAASATTQQQEEVDKRASPIAVESSDLVDEDLTGDPDTDVRPIKEPAQGKTTVQVETYATLNPGDKLFYPTQDIKQFDDAMMFVDIPKVLDQSKQRSFTMFFTPNEEYARRYSGIWSLNKRPVYVHKLSVKKGMPINRIKVINSKKIGDSVSNDELARGMCGDSIDGYINGIKIEQTLGDKASVEEYYICNPAIFLDHEETWMQFSATEWVKISPENTNTIKVPANEVRKTGVNKDAQEDTELAAL